ncbi:MAG TPA: hypothetical protein VGS21_01870 [Acidimicrobiales bacterium]|nr:hypothetical protein [Acidimicrobiales bacterium]
MYHPDRLKVIKPCLTVTGTVAYIRVEDDGDVHVDLSLPSGELHLLNQGNVDQQDGDLVTEIVPADELGCTAGTPPRPAYGSYNYGICTGAHIPAPPLGAEVIETGPYVLDMDHGWMEIHPVWSLKVIRMPSSPATTTSTTPPTTSTPPTVPPATSPPTTAPSGGAWCRASASPAKDGYAGDYDIYVTSNVPYADATASSATDTYGYETNGSGSAAIYLWHQSAGEAVTVTVGGATCYTTD